MEAGRAVREAGWAVAVAWVEAVEWGDPAAGWAGPVVAVEEWVDPEEEWAAAIWGRAAVLDLR